MNGRFLVDDRREIASLLRGSRLLEDLDEAALDEIAHAAKTVHIRGGETLFEEGAVGDSVYIVATGRLRAFTGDTERPRILREIGRGENVGEMSLLTGEPRTASVIAVRDTEAIRLGRSEFLRALEAHPGAMRRLVQMLASWLRATNRTAREASVCTLSLIPLSRDVDVRALGDALVERLRNLAPAVRIDAQTLETALGTGASSATPGSEAHAAATRWLDDRESEEGLVVYAASSEAPEWAQRCVRQSDLVVFIAPAGERPDTARAAADRLLGDWTSIRARCELLLLQEDGAPSGTEAWIGLGRFAAHHHLRTRHTGDLERLARHLTRRKTELVLSGGGARGFAHIGVIRALEEAGVAIDAVGGTSMGAVIGAQLACGLDHREMIDANRRWKRENPLWDLTVPIVSLVSGRKGSRLVESMFGGRHIEDLWLPYFCTSTNLTRARLVCHRTGPLARWVRASISIPGIAPPVRLDDGDLLVDGGVLNNLPIDVMAEAAGGRIIAVNAAPVIELSLRDTPSEMPTALRTLWDFVNPLSTTTGPNIFRILERAALVASLARAEASAPLADLELTPPLAAFGTFEWSALDALVEAGYEHARPRIEAWLRRRESDGAPL